MKTTAVALSFLFLLKGVGGCIEILTDVWATESGTSSFAFSVTVPASGFIQFVIDKEDSAYILQFSYNGGSLIGGSVNKAADVDITGDLTIGNASFTLSNIDRSENGTYRLRNPATFEEYQCVTLRVKGIVTVILNGPGSVEAGGAITFTCTTSTTTVPASTDYTYTWRVDNKIVTASSRYSFSSDKFTISDTSVDRENGKDVTCSAAEPIGSPSAESNSVTIYVTAPPTTTQPPCRLYVCYIGVYVAILSAVVILVVYFIVRCLFEILCGADFLLKIVLPSCCCMVICIICVVAICIPVEPDCDAGVGIAVPIVIVIILHPCVTVGVIVCHINNCPSLGESSESCLGRNRSILPICSGQGQDPGQPPQRQAEPQTRQDAGGTESNQGRPQPPQPKSGDEKHHSSVQKSNPEKSGSAVSGSHVAIDEEPFKPRKLPGIPADSKNARGLSANFDEVLPDKHRLTPLGQEARFDEFEETPKKKKKKKKSSEKDLDTSTDL